MLRFIDNVPQAKLRGTALVRLDLNTADDWRVQASLPTLQLLTRSADKIVILGHRGRPVDTVRGKSNGKFGLRTDAFKLGKLLKRKVNFIPHFRFDAIQHQIQLAPHGSIFLLENLRFLTGETRNDKKLAKQLAALGDYYVNDAFAVSHRADASVSAITQFLPSYGGLELKSEIENLNAVMQKPQKPLVLILGGGKPEDKMAVLYNLKSKASYILVGGVPANTFFLLQGKYVGDSIVAEAKSMPRFKSLLNNKKMILPADIKMEDNKILDMGTKSAALFEKYIARAKTIVWNGPMGLIENARFEVGTLAVAEAIAANKKAFSVVGGGETVMFLKKHKLDKKFSFISTGGGAMLDFLAGKKLPGIEALK